MMASESWWPSWPNAKLWTAHEMESVEEEKVQKKRLAAILRFVASMQQDLCPTPKFVRPCCDDNEPNDFFQYETNNEDGGVEIIFCANDFKKLIGLDDVDVPFFSFYAGPKGGRNENEKGLWLRLTRLGPSSGVQQPNCNSPALEQYLNAWLKESPQANSFEDLLTIHNIEDAPGIPSTISMRNHRQIKGFLCRYKAYLQMKLYQKTLEPIYNSLFEWNQKQHEKNEELVWGLGHARMRLPDGRLINGPILEVLVEVELASDGAILIRPREHTGVTLNREVVAALVTSGSDAAAHHSVSVVSQLHRTVGDMEASIICPGQPITYVPFLKRIAVELCPCGSFHATNKPRIISDSSKLAVSEAWCLYARSKPSSVAARDCNLLADRISLSKESLPLATWSLTHGPSKLREKVDYRKEVKTGGVTMWIQNNFLSGATNAGGTEKEGGKKGSTNVEGNKSNKPIFPLPTSESQDRIADLLLRQNYPAVIAEGPPGTGKTHVIANIVSAYLCEGKRVLVTSKNANALSVLRKRLPQSLQELCVDVSMSEVAGMRQLQQTVEKLAIRVSVASADIETEKCSLLQQSIDNLDTKLQDIDEKMSSQSERVRKLLQEPRGMNLIEKGSNLIIAGPWLAETLPKMSLDDLKSLSDKLKTLDLETDDYVLSVTGFHSPPSNGLISLAFAKSGSALSSFTQGTMSALASLPVVGALMDARLRHLNEELEKINVNGSRPESKDDWKTVAKALVHSLSVHTFEETTWLSLVKQKKWPSLSFRDQKIVKETIELLELAVEVKDLHVILDAENEVKAIAKCRKLDEIRTKLISKKKHQSEELADAAVVSNLSRNFPPDAQSALIKFSQIAGAAKFSKSAKPSKMSQRQRRRRQEYLDAFDRCCRFIPCWILTTSQISDYLPPECLFDLVVIDESSQSDITALPGMMRGKQWLIVGDGKQVSPTEAFVSEENIESLRATLPHSPLEDALLPGRSFFDLCAQAFPNGRVVLHEHFRCAPEIIEYSNKQFYDGRLVPLRLPTKSERFVPSLMDVKVVGGKKVGKVNEKEADMIVAMIKESIMEMSESNSRPRSIGVISLIGDEQSRLIRGRLLDACGPEVLTRHDVLIGDPPQFQGAERDIIFLSMVCSRGSCPTQNQQFHWQRTNVALSRARDRIVLVRSIDLRDISSFDDVKISVIEFFMASNMSTKSHDGAIRGIQNGGVLKTILQKRLQSKGYKVFDMGVIWKNGICVENEDTRVAIMVDCEESQESQWLHSYSQQKAIERVGWKCLRVDALSILVDYRTVFNDLIRFLAAHGVDEPEIQSDGVDLTVSKKAKQKKAEVIQIEDEAMTVMAVSSEEEEMTAIDCELDDTRSDKTKSTIDFSRDETIEATSFGEVVNLDFLRVRSDSLNPDDEFTDEFSDDRKKEAVQVGGLEKGACTDEAIDIEKLDELNESEDTTSVDNDNGRGISLGRKQKKRRKIGRPEIDNDEESIAVEKLGQLDEPEVGKTHIDNSNSGSESPTNPQKRRKIDKYSQDGRWHPDKDDVEYLDEDDDWYDTDSDIRNRKNEEEESCNEEMTTIEKPKSK